MRLVKESCVLTLSFLVFIALTGCRKHHDPVSNSGVKMATTKVQTTSTGHSVEQENILKRLKMDNTPGSIKHLYIVNSDGECLLYSTVKGKVTSSGKRLSPRFLDSSGYATMPVKINAERWHTTEVIQDDGTYGSSEKYIYWFDHKGQYHQHMRSNVVFVHISDKPIRFFKPAITLHDN